MDSNYCIWTPRIEATKEAQKRSRIAFVAVIIVSFAFIIANWNASLSWEKFFAFKGKFGVEKTKDGKSKKGTDGKEKIDEVLKESQRIALEEWVKSQTISVPFLGLHIGHSDGAVLGSFSLLIISLWFYLSMRRENEAIGSLLRDSNDESQEIRTKIFYGVTSHLLFSNFGQGRPIINSLKNNNDKNEPPKNIKKIFIKAIAFIKKILNLKGAPDETPIYIKIIFWILLYLPTIAIIFIIISDILSIFFLQAPFRSPQRPLIEIEEFKKDQVYVALIMDSIALIALFFTANFGRKAYKNERGTEEILKEYEQLVKPKESNGKKDVGIIATTG